VATCCAEAAVVKSVGGILHCSIAALEVHSRSIAMSAQAASRMGVELAAGSHAAYHAAQHVAARVEGMASCTAWCSEDAGLSDEAADSMRQAVLAALQAAGGARLLSHMEGLEGLLLEGLLLQQDGASRKRARYLLQVPPAACLLAPCCLNRL
jgi:hypothetical protein